MAQPKKRISGELDVYASICSHSEEMLSATKEGNWEQVIIIEEKRRSLIDQARKLSKKTNLNERARARKIDLIQKILSVDTETKTWVQARMKMLETGFKTGGEILKAYGSGVVS